VAFALDLGGVGAAAGVPPPLPPDADAWLSAWFTTP
jgi:hypothetical protein